MEEPVPRVTFACPGWKQRWAKRAAWESPMTPAMGMPGGVRGQSRGAEAGGAGSDFREASHGDVEEVAELRIPVEAC